MGCSGSKAEPLVIEPVKVEPQLPKIVRRTTSNQQPNRIVEYFIVVWLLPDSSTDVENEKTKLRQSVSLIKTFVDPNECVTYITNIRTEKIFLIVPTMDSWLHPIQSLSQLEKIYVLNSSFRENEKHKDQLLSSNTFYDIDTLYKQLKSDVELCELDLVYLTASAVSTQDGSTSIEFKRQEASFLCIQLMREMLFRIKFESNSKDEFANFCRINYADNEEQLRIIDDFEANYRPQKALRWLIRQCFIWKIMQRIQITQEIDIHYKIAFLIKHVNAQLMVFQENHSDTAERWIVYHGRTMCNDRFEALLKNNCGGVLSFASFFTAYTNKEVAIDFICRRLLAHPDVTGILFEIHINPKIRSTRSPLASLEEIYSDESNEKNGILFSMYTVFRIESVEQITQQSIPMWTVKLILIADDDPQLLRIVSPLRSTEVSTNPLLYMGKLYMDKGDYAQTERFFLGLLQDPNVLNQPRRLTRVLNGLAANYMNKGEYEKALKHYQQALEACLNYLPPDHTDLVPFYDGIGSSYFKQGDYLNAVQNYEKAADLLGHSTQPINEQFSNELNSRLDSAKKLFNRKLVS